MKVADFGLTIVAKHKQVDAVIGGASHEAFGLDKRPDSGTSVIRSPMLGTHVFLFEFARLLRTLQVS